jgi:hypothetical protein
MTLNNWTINTNLQYFKNIIDLYHGKEKNK